MNSAAGRCAIAMAHKNSIAYRRRENVACIEPDMCPNYPDLNRVEYAICGHAEASLPRREV